MQLIVCQTEIAFAALLLSGQGVPKISSSLLKADFVQMMKRPRCPPGASCSTHLPHQILQLTGNQHLELEAHFKDTTCVCMADLQQVEAIDALQVNAWDVSEGAHDAAVLAVDHQRALAGHIASVAHLTLAAAQVAAGTRLLHICRENHRQKLRYFMRRRLILCTVMSA